MIQIKIPKLTLLVKFEHTGVHYITSVFQSSKMIFLLQHETIMEDIPAGKMSQSSAQFPSPKKVHNPIGSQSQWSFGWQGNEKNVFNRANNSKGFSSYHNQSSIVFGDSKSDWKKEEIKQVDVRKKKDPVDNTRPVWNYNPKNAGKTTMVLGDEKPDYRKKDEINKIRTPTTLTNSRKK